MTSSQDTNIRIFDSQQKKITIHQGHTESINYLEKILIENKSKVYIIYNIKIIYIYIYQWYK
jgi:Cu/Ag efflux protein CusF